MTARDHTKARSSSATTRKPARGASGTPASGVDLTSGSASSEPKMPNDRDESVGMTGGIQSPRIQQGARDVKHGVQDTSRAPEADVAYKKLTK